MKLSDYVIDFLAAEGVTHIFEVCGGALAHLLDSLYERRDITAVSMHHEMAASMAAEGYARAKEDIGVAMATSGPGATNMITGIGSCFFDSIPCLFITGQVNTYEFKFDRPVRQIGFQETDIVSIVRPIVKSALLLKDEREVRRQMKRAVLTAKQGRPGPVLLDIPLNIQRAEIEPESLEDCEDSALTERISDKSAPDRIAGLGEIAGLVRRSRRPIILAGGGVRLSKSHDRLLELSHRARIPVVTSLMGLDSFPHDDPLFVGMMGTYGNRYANLAVANSDLVLALGARLDTRQTGTKPETFARGARIVHVDIDPSELNNKVKADYALNSDLETFLEELLRLEMGLEEEAARKRSAWIDRIGEYKSRYPSFSEPQGEEIDPNYFMHRLSDRLPKDAVICADVGQIQMWSAQTLEIRRGQRFLTEGGMASMGSALPMAIGASFACPDKTVVAITGDGGFQLNLQELQTVFHHRLPIKIVLINNGCYGMVRQFQEQYFNSRFQSTVIGYSCPDFQDVVSAYKIKSLKISTNSEISGALESIFEDMRPIFLEVAIDRSCKVMPKLSVNRPVEDQEPLLSRDELEENMIVETLQEPEEP